MHLHTRSAAHKGARILLENCATRDASNLVESPTKPAMVFMVLSWVFSQLILQFHF
jgi:hypothetical protein